MKFKFMIIRFKMIFKIVILILIKYKMKTFTNFLFQILIKNFKIFRITLVKIFIKKNNNIIKQ